MEYRLHRVGGWRCTAAGDGSSSNDSRCYCCLLEIDHNPLFSLVFLLTATEKKPLTAGVVCTPAVIRRKRSTVVIEMVILKRGEDFGVAVIIFFSLLEYGSILTILNNFSLRTLRLPCSFTFFLSICQRNRNHPCRNGTRKSEIFIVSANASLL